jgi:uncharacterized protein (TIGR01244 family)
MDIFKLDADLAYGEQPTFHDLKWLNEGSYRTVVDVREGWEQPEQEWANAERAGLRFVHVPVGERWTEEPFDRLAAILDDPGALPVYVHCDTGARSGVIALVCHAARRGWTVEQLDRTASRLGLDVPTAARRWLLRRSAAYLFYGSDRTARH